jgi:hypothetical protein
MVSYSMKVLSAIKYRNFFILVATFRVLFLSPLVDIYLRVASKRRVLFMDKHNETSFSLLIHELLFTHLQHTFDHVTLGLSHRT